MNHYENFFKRVWFTNPNASALSSTGPINGIPNPDRLFGIGDPSCLTAVVTPGSPSQAANCPIPFGPNEKALLVEYLQTL